MQNKELHKLGKTDLLTIIYEQEKQIEQLQKQISDLNKKLEDRTIAIQEAGSIADASIKLNKIFEMAQQAADDYLKSIKEVNKSSQECAEIKRNITNDENDFENTNDNLLNSNNLELDKDIRNINKEEKVGGLILVNKSLAIKKSKLFKRILVFLFLKISKVFLKIKLKIKEFKSKISKEKEIRASIIKLKKKEKSSKVKLKSQSKPKSKFKIIFSPFKLDVLKTKVLKLKKNKESSDSTELKISKLSYRIIGKIKQLLMQLKTIAKRAPNTLKSICKKIVERFKKIFLILKKYDIISPTFGKIISKINDLKIKKTKKKKVKLKKVKPTLKLAPKSKFDASQVKISIAVLEKELSRRKSKANKIKIIKTAISSVVVIIAFCIIAATQFFNVLQVSGNSMEPNLHTGELLITSKFFGFEKGDMIAFYYNDTVLIKRIIATGGDIVYIDDDGVVYINSTKLEEDYVKNLSYGVCDITYPYQVPENEVFVLGDNREVSIDSRSKTIGCISDEKIIGKIELKLNPFVIY